MIVEIEEFKQATSKDNSKETEPLEKTATRVLLRPNSETLFADLCLLNQKSGNKWTDKDALEVEAKILVRIGFLKPPLLSLQLYAHSPCFVACDISTPLLGPGPPPGKNREQCLSYILA